MRTTSEFLMLLLLGVLFGVLIGVGMEQETRTWIIRVLALFLTVALAYYLWTTRQRR